MANRFPLIFNSGAGQIQELAASDNLDLTSSNLVNAGILFTSSGSATAPSMSIGSGTTYPPGLYSPGTDQLAVATTGVERVKFGASEVVFNDGGTDYDFRVEGDTNANLLFVDASTDRVGVGNSSPATTLDVVGGYFTGGNNRTDNTTKSFGLLLPHTSNATSPVNIIGALTTTGQNLVYIGGSDSNLTGTSATTIHFYTAANATTANGTERLRLSSTGEFMFKGAGTTPGTDKAVYFSGSAPANSVVLDSSGRLLIGTSTARTSGGHTGSFQLEGTTFATATAAITTNSSDSNGAYLNFGKARGGSIGSTTIVQSGDVLGQIQFNGSDGTSLQNAALITASVDGTPGANDMPGRLVFSTTADGASSPTERMRIASGGGFKVSNTGAYTLGSNIHEINHNVVGSAAFHVYHSAASTPYGYYFKFTGANPNDATSYVFGSFDNVNANIYTIYSNGTVSARSDAKFKKNIETTRNGYLEDLAQLRVVKYNWYNHDDDTPKELGFIAQEVEQVFPGLVSTVPDKDDQGNETGEVSKSIKTSVFTPMLVKALQEALERIETLEAEVAALKAQ